MMKELELSVMYHSLRATQAMKSLLAEFEQQSQIRVRLKTLNWNDAWTELIKVALYHDGPDVSEIGNTWISDLARMVALRPFSVPDVKFLGGAQAFLTSLWQSSTVYGQPSVWAIPWLADTRILFYRQDLLAQAGIDPTQAFEEHAQLVETLGRLQTQCAISPWVMPTGQTRMTIHHAASWIWGAGGNFLSPDGKTAQLDQPEALHGVRQYFELVRFLDEQSRYLNDTQSDAQYWNGRAAATLSGPWLLRDNSIPANVHENTTFVSPPGVPFIGGSHLAIWRHTAAAREALQLVAYLSSAEVQIRYAQEIGLFPARLSALENPVYQQDVQTRRLIERIKTGRSFRSVPLWGMVESRISDALNNLWLEILQDPPADLADLVAQHLNPLTQRLNQTLAQE